MLGEDKRLDGKPRDLQNRSKAAFGLRAITGFITAILLLFGVATNGRSLSHISS